MRLSIQIPFFAAACLAMVSPAFAYINGGDQRNSLVRYEQALKSEGWYVACSKPILKPVRPNFRAAGIQLDPAEKEEFSRFVKQLVATALQALPPDDAKKLSVEDRDKLVEFSMRAIGSAAGSKREIKDLERIGPFECQAGAYEFHVWWEDKGRNGKIQIHVKQSGGVVPFVALRIPTAKK